MKNLFITGGNGEIGNTIANLFKNMSFNIIAPSSTELDCSNNSSINKYFADFKYDSIAVFVHCAGINNPKTYLEVKPGTIDRTVQINTLSFLYIIQHLSKLFDSSGRIAAISSIYGTISRKRRIEYSTSKHGLKGMVQTLALEMAEKGVLVNSVSPGFIATQLTYKNNPQEVIDGLIADVPLKKLGEPAYIAELVYFLCSEKNQFITGQDIIIDGGYLTGGFQS